MANMKLTDEQRAERSAAMKAMHARKKLAKEQEAAKIVDLAAVAQAPVEKPARKGRNLFDGREQQLVIYGADPNWEYHIFNNDPGRIESALASDWLLVKRGEVEVMQNRNYGDMEHSVEGNIEFQVRRTGYQDAARGVLMKKWKEYFQEDQQKTQDRIDQQEKDMIRQQGMDAGRIQNSYVPGPTGKVNKALTIKSELRGG